MNRFNAWRAIAGLAAISFVVPSFAQTNYASKKFDEEAMERYDMPPAPMTHQMTSSPGFIPFGGFISYQVNVNAQGQNIVGDAANEPSMVVDPNNPNNIAIGWRQFNSVTSNFRQGGYGYSTDGGVHWTFPGVLENNVFRSDPVLDSTAGSSFHYNSLRETFYTDEYNSSNQGQSWLSFGPAEGGDKNWIKIDRTSGSGSGFVYELWSTAGNNYGGRQFTRSTDGGHTWMNPIFLPDTPVWGTMDIGPNGDLYLVGTDGSQPSLRFLRSTNAKNGSVTPSFDLSVFVDMGGDLSYGVPVNPDGLGGQAWVAADRGNGPYRGYIYMLASVTGNSSNPLDVKLRRSRDGGVTWDPVVRINDDPTGQRRYHWFGSLSVAPNGRVDACWFDTRNDSSNVTSQLYYAYSTDGGATFSKNISITPSFNSTIGWPQQNKIGDYMTIISDDTGADICYPATFNGEQDVYFVRVAVTPQLVLPNSFSLYRGLLASGQLSDLFAADTNYLVGRAGPVANYTEPPLQVVVQGVSPSDTPSDISFTYVGHATSTSLQQQVALYNFQTDQYEVMDSRAATLTDTTVTVATTGDRSRFVNPADHTMKAKVTYKQVAPVAAQWNASLNQTIWTVTP